MSDDFDLLVRSTTGEPPSPEFVVVLRERVLAETRTRQTQANNGPIVQMDNWPRNEVTMLTKGRWMAGGLVAAIALFLGAVVVMNRDDNTTIRSEDPAAEPSETTVESAIEERRLQLLSIPFPDGGTLIEASGDANQVFVTIQYQSDRFDGVQSFYDEFTASDPRDWLRSSLESSISSRDVSWMYDPGNITARVRLADCGSALAVPEGACVTIRETGDYPP